MFLNKTIPVSYIELLYSLVKIHKKKTRCGCLCFAFLAMGIQNYNDLPYSMKCHNCITDKDDLRLFIDNEILH